MTPGMSQITDMSNRHGKIRSPKKDNSMPYKVQKRDIPKASAVLADAFQHDPLWLKFFEGELDINNKFRTFLATPVKYCYKFGEVYASSENLEGIAAWLPGDLSYMTMWNLIKSGSFLSGMKLGYETGKKMQKVFKSMEEDRKSNMEGISFLYLNIIGSLIIIPQALILCQTDKNSLFLGLLEPVFFLGNKVFDVAFMPNNNKNKQ